MHRRDMIRRSAIAAFGLGLPACSSRQVPDVVPSRPSVHLVPAHVSWERIIRTTVGLRPHRPTGFVLKAEKLDSKTVVHNYGHGGAGMSLSWGTGSMAADLALEQPSRRAAVLGCGAVGLASARELQRRGFDVVIYAMAVPPNTTSNMSLASFTPTSGLLEFRLRTPEWEEQFRRAVTIAYREWQLLIGPRYGVSWLNHYTPTDDERAASGENVLLPAEASSAQTLLRPGEHPFPTKYAVESVTMRFEPSIYLDAVLDDFLIHGGRLVTRKFEDVRDLMALGESVIVNCTGLGSRELFDDQDLVPLKGQLTAVIPERDVDYGTNGGVRSSVSTPGIGIHMLPRSDGIILGGTSEKGVWTLEVNEEERKRIVEGHIELFDSMRHGTAPVSRLRG